MSEIIEMEILMDEPEIDMEVEPQNGTMDHSKLMNRDKAAQHPIGAINGLEAELEKKLEAESDPTVPAWAKDPEKPKYTPAEVGAQPAGSYASLSALQAEAEARVLADINLAQDIADLEGDVTNKQDKPEEAVVIVDTPPFARTVYICNASGTILPGEPLHASFADYTQNYYCFIDKETSGAALLAGVFKLALNYNDFANAIPQYFTFGDGTYVTGNPTVTGGTLEVGTSWQRTSIIDFKTISPNRISFEMRSAGQSDSITLASTTSGYKKIEATLSGYALLGYTAWRDNFSGNANTIIPQYNWQHYFHSDSSFSIAPTASARFGYLTAMINMELVEDRIKSSVTGGAASTDNRLGNISATGTRKLSGIVTAERINKVGQSVITGSSVLSLALQGYASSLTTYLNGTRIVVRGWK